MHKSKLIPNKPVNIGMTILENGNMLMYHFFYNELKKKQFGHSCELLYIDTDSFPLGGDQDG